MEWVGGEWTPPNLILQDPTARDLSGGVLDPTAKAGGGRSPLPRQRPLTAKRPSTEPTARGAAVACRSLQPGTPAVAKRVKC